MNQPFIQYLVEISIYLGVFLLFYKLLFEKLTHFMLRRTYLLSGLILSLIMPLIVIPIHWSLPLINDASNTISLTSGKWWLQETSSVDISNPMSKTPSGISLLQIILFLAFSIYLIGAAYKLVLLVNSLRKIRTTIRNGFQTRDGRYRIIHLESDNPAYSFFNYIFISKKLNSLSEEDLERIKEHEQAHANQLHTLDILLVEVLAILLWFNPLIKYIKYSFLEIHEYLADNEVCVRQTSKKEYSNLLLGLTSEIDSCSLVSRFGGKQIGRRITMLAKPRSGKFSKLTFIFVLPIVVFIQLSFSHFEGNVDDQINSNHSTETIPGDSTKIIGKIRWSGNTIYSDRELSKVLGLEVGDEFSQEIWDKMILTSTNSLHSIYLDNGYMFFQAQYETAPLPDGTIELSIILSEGKRTIVDQVTISGIQHYSTAVIRSVIKIQQGDWFSRAKILEAIRAIDKLGIADPENIMPIPTPKNWNGNSEFAAVDIEFKLVEL